MRNPKTIPRIMSLRRAMVYPKGVRGSDSSSSVVRRWRNLRKISFASIMGF